MASAVDASGDDTAFLKELGWDECVFCHSAKTRRKVLFCLHLSCAVCLINHNPVVCASCQVTTPDPGPGRNLLESLTDWHATLCQEPDCDDYVAVNKCVSCGLLLCSGHSDSHGLLKRNRDHTLKPISPSGCGSDSNSTTPHCQLHLSEKIKFCSPCKALVCVECFAEHSSHELLEVEKAAEQFKVKLLEKEDSAGEGSTLQTAHRVKQIDGKIDTIHKEKKSLSEAIALDFQKCHQLLSRSEEDVKAHLAKISLGKIKLLEERKQQLRVLTNLHPVQLLKACRGFEEHFSAGVKQSKEEEASEALSTTLYPYSRQLEAGLGRARMILHPTHHQPVTLPCCAPLCCNCPDVLDTTTDLPYPYPVKGNFDCRSSSVVYLVTCTACDAAYIGETENALATRMSGHRNDDNGPVNAHFRKCVGGERRVTVLESALTDQTKIRALETSWIAHVKASGQYTIINRNQG